MSATHPKAASVRAEYGIDRAVIEQRVTPRPRIGQAFEMRAVPNGTGGTDLRLSGFASITCRDQNDNSAAYEMEDAFGTFIESVQTGAFRKTISEGCDTAFLLNHTGMTLSRTKSGTLKLSEEMTPFAFGHTGLYYEARLDPQNAQVQAMRSAVERGDLDECSFAFRVMRQEWNKAYDRRWITECSLDKGDVSLVNYGASPHTGGTVSLRQRWRRDKVADIAKQGGTGYDADDTCSRCGGSGSITLQGKSLKCPQCKGTGDSSHNAGTLDSPKLHVHIPDHTSRARIALERELGKS